MKVGLIYGGAGSAAVATKNLGLEVVYNYEPRGEHYIRTFVKNFCNKNSMVGKDFTAVKRESMGTMYEVDLAIGQPDCKMFSNLRTKIKEKPDIKDTQLFDFLLLVQRDDIDMFIVENLQRGMDALMEYIEVRAPLDHEFNIKRDGGTYGSLIYKDYHLRRIEIDAKDFLPQSRKRSFLVGIKKELGFELNYKEPTPVVPEGVQSILKTLEYGTSHHYYHNHKPSNHSKERIKGFAKLKYGESFYRTQNNRRLDPNRHSPTITSHCSQQVHYRWPRTLTVRENARIMGWPDDFIFTGGTTQQLDQVGKAIVIPVIQYLLEQLIKSRGKNG